jgi:phosphoketolase
LRLTVVRDARKGFWRAHQVPLAGVDDNPSYLQQFEDWLRSYRPDELFDDKEWLIPQLNCQRYAYEWAIDKPKVDQWTWPS